MPAETITIAIPPVLRDLIADHAAAQHTTQDRFADTLLQQELERAETLQGRGEALATHYLTHPRLAETSQEKATVHIQRTTNDRAVALARLIAAELGQSVPKGRVMMALLWTALEPIADDARLALPKAAPARPTITAGVPNALNADLLDLAQRLDISREAVVEELLDTAFADLATDATVLSALQQAITRGATAETTLQFPRRYDLQLQMLADQAFGGVKSQALVALLWYELERTEKPALTSRDRPVMLNGALYARVAQLTLALRKERGRAVAIRAFVEQALEEAVTREERRLQSKADPSRHKKL